MSDFNDSREEIKKGNYQNAFLLFLLTALISVTGFLVYTIKTKESAIEKVVIESEAREDRLRMECARAQEVLTDKYEKRFDGLQKEVRDLRDATIADLREGRAKSEQLVIQTRKSLKAINIETQKTRQASKELDSVSKSLIQ